MIAVKVPELRC